MKTPVISVPPTSPAEALAREAHARACHELRTKEAKYKRPRWCRRFFWIAVWRYAANLSAYDIDKLEYDNAFQNDLTRK